MTAASRPKIDKLPAEIRTETFKLVLCSESALTVPHSARKDMKLADTAILQALVNDPLFGEAYEVFYSHNVFRINTVEQGNAVIECSDALSHIRHLEFVNLANFREFLAWDVIENLVKFGKSSPALKSMTIGYDGMWWKPLRAMLTGEDCIFEGEELVCTSIGQFVLQPEDTHFELRFKHLGLVECWVKLQSEPVPGLSDIANELADVLDHTELLEYDYEAWNKFSAFKAKLGLAGWTVCYDMWRAFRQSGEDGYEALSIWEQYLLGSFHQRFEHNIVVPGMHSDMAGDTKLSELAMEEHGAEVMEWVGNLLVHNTRMSSMLLNGGEWYMKSKNVHEAVLAAEDNVSEGEAEWETEEEDDEIDLTMDSEQDEDDDEA